MMSIWFKAKEYSFNLWIDFIESIKESKCANWEKLLQEKRDRKHFDKKVNIMKKDF